MESWLTYSVEDRESFSSPDDMGCTEVSSSCSNVIDDPLYLRRFSQGISRVAAGTWGIFSSYDGDAHSKREFV